MNQLDPPQPSWLASRDGVRFGFILSGIFVVVVTILVLANAGHKTVTPVYFEALLNWSRHAPLYVDSERQFHYFPFFVLLFKPFAMLGQPLGDIAWRWFNFALFLTGLWRVSRLLEKPGQGNPYTVILLLALPASLGAARNGQANMTLAGIMLHATIEIFRSRWWLAALWLVLGVVAKPLGLVMLLLATVIHRRLIPWVAAISAATVALLWLTASPNYVWSQLIACWHELVHAAPASEMRFHDFNSMLRVFGVDLPDHVVLTGRLAAAVITLAICWLGVNTRPKLDGALLLLGMSTSYLMLFNPMTESNSYIMFSPVVATFAVKCFTENRPHYGWGLAILALGLGTSNYGNPIHPWTLLWLKPLLAGLFMGYLCFDVLQNKTMLRRPQVVTAPLPATVPAE